jgi:hypothetical protein
MATTHIDDKYLRSVDTAYKGHPIITNQTIQATTYSEIDRTALGKRFMKPRSKLIDHKQ